MSGPINQSQRFFEIDVEGLPDEVLKELRLNRSSKREKIFEIIHGAKDGASTDHVIVDLWRKHQLALKRNSVLQHITILVNQGRIKRVRAGWFIAQES